MRIDRFEFNEECRLKDESLFTSASGKLGVRGCFEEGAPFNQTTIRGTYINGFADTEEITYNEKLFGFPEEKQTIVNLPDAQTIELRVDNDLIVCWSNKVSDYHYSLDMSNAFVSREFVYDTSKGKIKISFERFTSFVKSGLFNIRCTVKSLGYNGELNIRSILNGDVKNFTNASDPRVASGTGKMIKTILAEYVKIDGYEFQKIESETNRCKRVMSVLSSSIVSKNGQRIIDVNKLKEDDVLTFDTTLDIKDNDEIVIDKYAYYHEIPDDVNEQELLVEYINQGYESLKAEQKQYMESFWNTSRVLIDSDEIKQEHLDYCLYAMLCSAGRDGKTSIAAKGLSGEGYEGHYFWDCETYIYPFFLVTNPEIAKSLILYRYSKLDEARKHARNMGHRKGALYPWRTITGSECSSYFPSGSAQYHINGDIARAFRLYWDVTEDTSILKEICEVLLETARLWMDVGHFDNGVFKIDCVTGPDEYTCLVSNNYYTNSGAANNLRSASKLIKILQNSPDYDEFVNKYSLSNEELMSFEEASDSMYYPYSKELGIIKQDDSFLDKKRVELSSFAKEDFPLLLHYHPLYLNRLQICKQADAVLCDYLFNNLDPLTSMRTYEYYEKVTTHDSSLSKCIFGIIACKLGDLNKAKEYFKETLATDLDDQKGNTRDGLHMANMGGCYLMVRDGFAGMRISENGLSLYPMLPDGIRSYDFNINYKNRIISIHVDIKGTTVKLHKSSINKEPISIKIYDQEIKIDENEQRVIRKAKAVIFDLDGVITDTAVYHYEAWKKIADELNVPFDERRNENFKGVSRKTCLELLLKWGNIKVTDKEFDELLIKKNEYYKDLLKNLTPSSILPGILDCLKILHENSIKVSLFSVSKNTPEILKRLELEDAFDEIVCGHDITYSKPHYEGYLLAAKKMGVDQKNCVMVEDSISGINGAKALSMKTIAIMKDNVANADICLETTEGLINILNYL